MPAKYEGRTIDLEKGVAARIQQLREDAGLSYQDLAEQMKAVGCTIHPSGIQKTEKSGRRITVDELMGYARAFDVSTAKILGEPAVDVSGELWSTYIGLERLSNVNRSVRQEYVEARDEMRTSALGNPALVKAIRDRQDKYMSVQERKAKRDAANDGEDVSTPEKLEAYMERYGHLDVPAIAAARDVLEGADDGEDQ